MEIRHLTIDGSGGQALSVFGATVLLRDSTITHGIRAVTVDGDLTLRNVTFEGPGSYAVMLNSGVLNIDGAVIRGWTSGIFHGGQSSATVDIMNLVASGITDLAIDLPFANGTIAFSTIADSGMNSGTGPRAFRCGTGLTVRSSIVWAPGTTARVPLEGCNVANTIAGPTGVPGALNLDPQFVDSAYHIAATSPARDKVDAGPATDFEGDPRPRGNGFDIGADEQ
jgi:hypothetical protein